MSDPQDASAVAWRRCGPPLEWQHAAGNGAVFDPASGETHFLNELPAMLLVAIDSSWRTTTSLISDIAGPLTLQADDLAKVVAALRYLEGAELVESRHETNP